MIPEAGHLSLIFAMVLSFLVGFVPLLDLFLKKSTLGNFLRPISLFHSFLILSSFLCLVYSFYLDDFSVAYIANNSNTNLPVYYKLAATWGAHEGSLLLWISCLSIWFLAYMSFTKGNENNLVKISYIVINQIIFSFIAFTLFTSNPFARILPISPIEGADLNPLLQDFAFTIHPPLLYLGYSGLAIPFATAIGALVSGNIDAVWSRHTRPWAQLSCAFLTLGIGLGSWWAYYELGWGGWWFWDPVENAAFVPWLITVALLHSLIITEKRGLFRNWSLFLCILAFATSLLGTFLVRSGILTSVHAFALDPERGVFILGIFSYFIFGSSIIYFLKNIKIDAKSNYELFSKEFGFLLNNLLLVILAISILFGTLFPLFYEAFNNGDQISVGAPYYEILIVPFVFFLSILQGVGLYLGWNNTKNFSFLGRLLIVTFTLMLIVSLFVYISFGNINKEIILPIFLFSWIFSGTLLDKIISSSTKETLNFLLQRSGVILSHLGTAIMIIGIGVVSIFSVENEVILEPGQKYQMEDTTFEFINVEEMKAQNYISTIGLLEVSEPKRSFKLVAEKRYYPASNQIMTEAGIYPTLKQDYYVTLGDNIQGTKWSFRLLIKPFVRFIWLGCLFISFGIFISIYLNFRKRNV